MEGTLVFLDGGFLSKLTKHFGRGKHLKYDIIRFSKLLVMKQNLFCKKIFYYTAPPYQSEPPTKKEELMKKGYDIFIRILKRKGVEIREGRVQRLKIDENYLYKQKGVDTLLTIDLSHIKEDYPKIKKIILVSSDTDFCPVIRNIRKRGTEVYLFTYFDRIRNSPFSLSNELLACCSKCFKLTKQDFENALLKK